MHQLYPASCWEWRAKGRSGPCPQGSKNLEDIFSFCLRVCVCVISEYLCMFMHFLGTRGRMSDILSLALHLHPLRLDLSLNLVLGWQTANLRESLMSQPLTELEFSAFTATLLALENWGFELRSSCLCTKYLLPTDVCP